MTSEGTLPDLGVRHALLLQGPAGPFMLRFAHELHASGVRVTKVNFHAGDRLFFPPSTGFADVVPFREPFAAWDGFVRQLIRERHIDGVFVFGDCRWLHRRAVEAAEALGAKVWVFEEGYLRPDWITLEEHGVNGFSRMPRDPAFYREHDPGETPPSTPPGPSFRYNGWYSTLNAMAFTLANGDFRFYAHHRDLNCWRHARWHVRSAWRKWRFGRAERGMLQRFTGELSGRYFFVPLQVHCDFQLRHSPYDDVLEMVHEVVETFAEHGRPDDHLVFKHHPMDRAYREYGPLFAELRRTHGLGERLHYCHDLHLPTLLQHAKGTITINSTVGLQSVHHGTPVKVLGTAVYDMKGLVDGSSLAEFLQVPGPAPDEQLYRSFRRWLLHHNQANGNFYVRLRGRSSPTGIRWFPKPPPSRRSQPTRAHAPEAR